MKYLCVYSNAQGLEFAGTGDTLEEAFRKVEVEVEEVTPDNCDFYRIGGLLRVNVKWSITEV